MTVVRLGPHERMTPEQALAVVSVEPWQHVMVIGYHNGEETICVRSSHMSREFANWLIDHAKQYILTTGISK